MTTRRTHGMGTTASARDIRAAQADLLASLPGIRLPDLGELRTRGVVGRQHQAPTTARRSLGTGQVQSVGMPGEAGQGYGALESSRIVDGEASNVQESSGAEVDPSGQERNSPTVS
ncbi:hypothetical protein [Streptomyces sp. CoH17]|uniref:hypothetical protein n=1 Tax=Streptomyces sp. CoH17 TaxID=2992806 RepID=UPI00226FD135|nr:hypothetical protein [Streptomyces sp. CoH17]